MPKRLLVCFDNVGDLVFNSALSRALSKEADASLSLLCKDYTRALGTLLPGVQRVFAADPFWDKSPSRGKGSFWTFLRVIWSLRQEGFDEAFISSGDWRAALFLRLAGIPRIYALKGRKNARFLSKALPMPGRQEPVVKSLLRSFSDYLPPLREAHYQLDPSKLPDWTSPHPSRPMVVLHAFAGSPLRCAPLPMWERLAIELEARGYYVLWTGTKEELDRIRAAYPGRWSAEHYIDKWARDLFGLATVWRHARIFIGHDSGPLHVAHALSVPVIGLFLPGEPLRTFPQGPVPYKMLHRANPSELSFEDLREAVSELEATLSDGSKQ